MTYISMSMSNKRLAIERKHVEKRNSDRTGTDFEKRPNGYTNS